MASSAPSAHASITPEGSQKWVQSAAPFSCTCFVRRSRCTSHWLRVRFQIRMTGSPSLSSDEFRPEGYTEQIIGAWLKQDPARRRQVVITSKITGADNINRRNIMADCEASLRRLGTDYLDV